MVARQQRAARQAAPDGCTLAEGVIGGALHCSSSGSLGVSGEQQPAMGRTHKWFRGLGSAHGTAVLRCVVLDVVRFGGWMGLGFWVAAFGRVLAMSVCEGHLRHLSVWACPCWAAHVRCAGLLRSILTCSHVLLAFLGVAGDVKTLPATAPGACCLQLSRVPAHTLMPCVLLGPYLSVSCTDTCLIAPLWQRHTAAVVGHAPVGWSSWLAQRRLQHSAPLPLDWWRLLHLVQQPSHLVCVCCEHMLLSQ
jgi:hypothetical protein